MEETTAGGSAEAGEVVPLQLQPKMLERNNTNAHIL
jgi:hypothetical protein